MVLFSVICLTVILLIMHHLLNWGWREAVEKDDVDANFGMFVITVGVLILTCFLVRQIIIWGKDLL